MIERIKTLVQKYNPVLVSMQNEYFGVKAISNSAMSAINPDEGGNPRKYQNFLNEDSDNRVVSLSLERGTLLHKYLQSPDSFIISDVVKPTEMMESWVTAVYNTCKNENHIDFKAIICKEKQSLNVYANIKDEEKIYSTFLKDGLPYFRHLVNVSDKILMSTKTKEIVTTLIDRINAEPLASSFVNAGTTEFENVEVHNELDIFFNITVKGETLLCKAKLDKIVVDHDEKCIKFGDYKTTGYSAYNFAKIEVLKAVAEDGTDIKIYQEKGSFYSYRYYRQIAWYLFALYLKFQDLFDNGYRLERPIIIVLETNTNEKNVVPYPVSNDSMIKGIYEFEDILTMIAAHTIGNDWTKPLTYFEKEI